MYREPDIAISPKTQGLAQKHIVSASPVIFLNGKLFASGGFDKDKFLTKLEGLTSGKHYRFKKYA
jgi:glutaredoxin